MDKPAKKKGPIRVEAIVPFLIVTALVVAYFVLFFDGHVRRGMEWAATYANGAEVNIGSLHTSFIHATGEIREIQVTDPIQPTKNRLQIGSIDAKLLWDALLRGKFVIRHAGVTNIEIGTDRKRPGRVLPPPPDKPSVFAKIKDQVSRAVLAEAGDLLEGFDPTQKLKDLKNLKSATRIRELQAELSQKQAQWEKSLAALPGEKDLADLQQKVNSINPGDVKNPAEVPGKIAQVQSLIQESEKKVNAVQDQAKALVNDVNQFQASVAQIDALARQDVMDLEKQLKIPSLDARSIANQLFGTSALQKVAQAERYVSMARAYMPAKKDTGPKFEPPKRAQGKIYEFGRPKGYPLFWLQKAVINSQGEHSLFGGKVEGTATDLTSNPPLIGRPAVISLNADFPKRDLRNILAEISLDHTKDVATEKVRARVGSFPVGERVLSDSDGFKFAIGKAAGSGGLEASLSGDKIQIVLESKLQQVDYRVSAKSKLLESTLQETLKGVPIVQVRGELSGTWNDPSLSLDSNLASAIQAGLQKQLQVKLAEARRKIDDLVQSQITKQKTDLMNRVKGAQNQVMGQVEARKKQAEGIKAQATAKLDAVKKQAGGFQQKGLDALKKKLPFGR